MSNSHPIDDESSFSFSFRSPELSGRATPYEDGGVSSRLCARKYEQVYEWLESARAAELIPPGPAVWICGDCHIGNLGPIASSDGKVEIQIRDLDQTVIGNPAHDIIRLGLSLAMAARSSDLPGVTAALMMEQVIEGYREGLRRKKPSRKGVDEIASVRTALKHALRRKWRHLAEERIEDVTPRIHLGKRFWALSKEERREIARIFDAYLDHCRAYTIENTIST